MRFHEIPDHGDPSGIQQYFSSLKINLLCCRFWWLKKWESQNMSFPYWRMYWNNASGASITFGNLRYELLPGMLYLIPPNTPFSSGLLYNDRILSGYSLEGGRVTRKIYRDHEFLKDTLLHLFIHFNLGIPYDFIQPNIYSTPVTLEIRAKIDQITSYIIKENRLFDLHISLVIYSLISDAIAMIPQNDLNIISTDTRVLKVLKEIEKKPERNLRNSFLADIASMSPNSFARLFKQEVGETPQNYVKRRRIEKAGSLLHHSNFTIDNIAQMTGFTNRYHFSRIFREQTGVSPAAFRKNYILK
jgi:AraC-like DNA-binding protein